MASYERRKSSAVSIGNWMWTLLLSCIPVVNIIFFIVTACTTHKASKRSWAIANIIWVVAIIVITTCTVVFFGEQILSFLLYLMTTPVSQLPLNG